MRKSPFLIIVSLIIVLMLTSCGGSVGDGPQTWIDNLENETTVPFAPLQIQAHAADVDGVSQLDFFVIQGQDVGTIYGGDGWLAAIDVGTIYGGDGRLVEAIYEWNPPEPGRYTLGVQATDNNGNAGQMAIASIEVSSSQAVVPTQELAEEPETEAVTDIETETPTHTATATHTSAPTSQPTQQPSPTQQPAPTNTPFPTVTPTVFVPTPDTTPPTIHSANVSPNSILTDGPGCPSSPRTATVTIVVSDPGGIGAISVFWNVNGDSGSAPLANVGGDTYEGQAGPVTTTGTMNLFVNIEDSFGNDALSDVMFVTVQNCIL